VQRLSSQPVQHELPAAFANVLLHFDENGRGTRIHERDRREVERHDAVSESEQASAQLRTRRRVEFATDAHDGPIHTIVYPEYET
jgi:hypothetical protein